MPARIKGLDGLRGIAATAVVVQHSTGIPGDIAGLSVYAFFVLSGYLITDILHRSRLGIETGRNSFPSALSDFWQRRIRRLCPVYFLALAAAVVIDSWLWQGELLRSLPWYLTYLQNYYIGFTGWGTFTHTWTLAIEQQFYVLFSLLLLLAPARLHAAAICAVLVVDAISLQMLKGAVPGFALWLFPQYAIFFLGAGGLLALAGHRLPAVMCSPIAAVLALAALGWQIWTGMLTGEPMTALRLAALCIVTIAVVRNQSSALTAALDLPLLRWLGTVSYCLYVVHVPVLKAAFVYLNPPLDTPMGKIEFFAIVFGVSVMLAAASWQWLERPLIKRASANPQLRPSHA